MAGDFISRGGREFRVPWKGTSKGPEARQCKVCGLKAPGTNTLARPVKGSVAGTANQAGKANQGQVQRARNTRCLGPGPGESRSELRSRGMLAALLGCSAGRAVARMC